MNVLLLHLASLSAKVAVVGGLAWIQLRLLRRAPASSRSRLCSLALLAILLLALGEFLTPAWTVAAPVVGFTAAARTAGRSAAAHFPIASTLAFAWFTGTALLLLRAIAGRTTLALRRRRSTGARQPSDTAVPAGVDVRLAGVQTPILSGLLRPAILLPAAARDWTLEQRRMVLTHELTHYRQGDCWTNLLAQFLRAALWFHPVVWMLAARLSREQELTCDEAVVASGHPRHDYAAFLLEAARNLHSQDLFVCAMAGSGAQSLKERFATLLDPQPRRPQPLRFAAVLTALALIAAGLSVVRPVWSQARHDDKVYRVGEGVEPPRVLTKVDPQYTQEAKDARIEGSVVLTAVISADGKAENIDVVRGLDLGLDQNAIDAVGQWIFSPGLKDGVPVAVKATIEIRFRLQ